LIAPFYILCQQVKVYVLDVPEKLYFSVTVYTNIINAIWLLK